MSTEIRIMRTLTVIMFLLTPSPITASFMSNPIFSLLKKFSITFQDLYYIIQMLKAYKNGNLNEKIYLKIYLEIYKLTINKYLKN